MEIRGTCTVEIMPTENLQRRRSLYAMLFKIYFEEALNTCCTQCSGICTVIGYKTRQFLLFAVDQLIFSKDEETLRCVMKELLKEWNKLLEVSIGQLLSLNKCHCIITPSIVYRFAAPDNMWLFRFFEMTLKSNVMGNVHVRRTGEWKALTEQGCDSLC